jgi:hypothetical protein
MDSAEDKGAVGPDNDYGWGIINALSTVSKFYKIDHDVAIESI